MRNLSAARVTMGSRRQEHRWFEACQTRDDFERRFWGSREGCFDDWARHSRGRRGVAPFLLTIKDPAIERNKETAD